MSRTILFTNAILRGINKGGVLKPDDQGRYTVVLGAIGVLSTTNEVYSDTPEVRKRFAPDGRFAEMVAKGLCRGEFGHPDPKGYSTSAEFERRVRRIDEKNISHHIYEIWLEDIIYQGKKTTCIMGRIKPVGPYGAHLKEMLDDPGQNVTFSGRYFSDVSKVGGLTHREVHTVITWDFVFMPGVPCAQKYMSPSLESVDGFYVTEESVKNQMRAEQSMGVMSMENGGLTAAELWEDLGLGSNTKPALATRSTIISMW